MAVHNEPSPFAGNTVKIKKDVAHFQFPNFGGSDFRVEDWWDRVAGKSWTVCEGNPACIVYALRSGVAGLPPDDDVLYGKTPDGFGYLVHISEIEEVEDEVQAKMDS